MNSRRLVATILLAVALGLLCDIVFEDDHGADFAEEVNAWTIVREPRRPAPIEVAALPSAPLHELAPFRQDSDGVPLEKDREIPCGFHRPPCGLSPPSLL